MSDFYENEFWPFPVPDAQKGELETCPQYHFLVHAYSLGYAPYRYGMCNFGASNENRGVSIVLRSISKGRWQVFLGENGRRVAAAFLNDFDRAAELAYCWLKGREAVGCLRSVSANLVNMGSVPMVCIYDQEGDPVLKVHSVTEFPSEWR